MTGCVELRSLTAGYGVVPAVHDVHLSVHRGEVVAPSGSNGDGQTTTLNAIAGVLKPLPGHVQCAGRSGHSPDAVRVRGGLACVPEERLVFTTLTAGDNRRLGCGSPERAASIFTEFVPHLSCKAELLSGGQQQMLTLARALAANGTLLSVDELSLGLAPIIATRLFDGLRAAADPRAGALPVEQNVRCVLGRVHRRGWSCGTARARRRGESEFGGRAGQVSCGKLVPDVDAPPPTSTDAGNSPEAEVLP
jgi:branched-chain amino acid transport system ATP-binding protein